VRLPAGYVARPAAWDDLDAVAGLVKACDRADAGVEDPVREHLEEDWRTARDDLGRHAVLVEAPDGSLTALAQVFGVNPERSVDAWVRVHPGHRGIGLGTALATWTEGRAAELVPVGASSKLYSSIVAEDEAAGRLLRGRGYMPVRVFWHMERELEEAIEPGEPPPGCAIQPYEHPRDAETVYEVLSDAFADHWGFEPYPHELAMEQLSRLDPGLIWLAVCDGEVVGALVGRTIEGSGWIDDLGVRRPWRGRGIAKGLLRRAFAELAGRGITSVALNVDSENTTGATRLYESVGMRPRRAWRLYERPLSPVS
jgi:mycothiol synthase